MTPETYNNNMVKLLCMTYPKMENTHLKKELSRQQFVIMFFKCNELHSL